MERPVEQPEFNRPFLENRMEVQTMIPALVIMLSPPDPACGCMVCPLRLVGSAQFDFGAVSFFEYRYAAAEISWLSANHAPAQL